MRFKHNFRSCLSYKRVGRIFLKSVNGIVDTCVLAIFLLLLFFGFYGIWDSSVVHENADSVQYSVYKPDMEDTRSFVDFAALNPEVRGWIEIYGTNIDYPLVQASDNEKYLNTSADGEYSLTGSVYLDYRNASDLSDFNTIIYGHHMADEVMFGELDHFSEDMYFNTHEYGMVFANGKYYGLKLFAYLETDAYNDALYSPGITDPLARSSYLTLIDSLSIQKRDVEVSAEDNILLLSTCISDFTNGRGILVGKLTEEVYEDPFPEEIQGNPVEMLIAGDSVMPKVFMTGLLILAIVVIALMIRMMKKRNRRK